MDKQTRVEATRAVRQVRLELASRRIIISMIGVMATLIGIGMMLTGAPAFLEEWFSPWSRYAIGGVIFLGGLMINLGALVEESRPGWYAQVMGLVMMTLWCAALGVVHTVLYIISGAQWVAPGEKLADPSIAGRAYIPLFYWSFFVITLTVLVTSLRVGRPERTVSAGTLDMVNKGLQ